MLLAKSVKTGILMIDRVQVHRLPDGSLTALFVYNADSFVIRTILYNSGGKITW